MSTSFSFSKVFCLKIIFLSYWCYYTSTLLISILGIWQALLYSLLCLFLGMSLVNCLYIRFLKRYIYIYIYSNLCYLCEKFSPCTFFVFNDIWVWCLPHGFVLYIFPKPLYSITPLPVWSLGYLACASYLHLASPLKSSGWYPVRPSIWLPFSYDFNVLFICTCTTLCSPLHSSHTALGPGQVQSPRQLLLWERPLGISCHLGLSYWIHLHFHLL